MTTREPDPLQAQLDGIPVPCYTWLADRGDFVLERANRAAFDLARDTLAPLLGARVGDVYPDRPDIAEDLEERLVHQALHDPLTGLPNRLLFQERLDVAQPLVRFGGDEFAVLAELSDEREAAELAQRLATALEAPFDAGRDVFVTAAIGIAVEDDRRGGPAELIQGADAAMQRVKARGAAAYEVFDPAMRGRLRDRLQIEDGLHRALANDELRLFYQPIVALEPRAVVAVEALVHWQHPDEGLLAPGRFLPVAEQHGRLISAIGDWVLRRACEDARRWPPGVRVSVNVARASWTSRVSRSASRRRSPAPASRPSGSLWRSPRRR
jgi:GGDEF domain-containing protein